MIIINSSLTTSDNLKFHFATDGEGNYGYLGADDSFIPFKSAPTVLTKSKSWSGSTNNAISLTETIDIGKGKTLVGAFFNSNSDFDAGASQSCFPNGRLSISSSYDSETGIVTVNFGFMIWTSYVTITRLALSYVVIYY